MRTLNAIIITNINDIIPVVTGSNDSAEAPITEIQNNIVSNSLWLLIISKNCGVSEYIEDNKNGILIKPSSLDLKNAIEYYYNNPKLINYHGINNYKFFKKSLLNSSESYKAFVSLIKKNYENSFWFSLY